MRILRIPRASVLRVTALVAVILVSTTSIGGQRHRAKLSSDLLEFELRRDASRTRVIVRGSRSEIEAMAARYGAPIVRWLNDSAVLLANSEQVSDLAGDSANDVLSGDSAVVPFMSVSNASTAADQTRAGTGGLLGIGAIPGVTGQGVTIAVVDSGISYHPALAHKVIANVSFVTGDPQVTDAFGHGTHIAGTIAGNGSAAVGVTPLYTGGIAPGIRLVNVRVLGKNGAGWTSDVIAGIEWTIANRDKYNIRIMNLSLGHPVTEPSITDPLCIAVKKAAAAGIIVFASAGNAGKTPDGSQVLGGITSPGNSPYAITVGAINTKGTVTRDDDVMATYSSRGPTRYEFAVKPDVVAPGNKIISLEAPNAILVTTSPQLHVAGKTTNGYMTLNGTSMSTAIVSGGAALLIQANPNITSEQVKIAMQSGATFMADGGLMGGGAGSVNFWSSQKTSANGLNALVSTVVGGLASPASGLVYWDAGTMASRVYQRSGIRLLSLLDAPLAWLLPGFLRWGDLNIIGLSNPIGMTRPNEILWGDVANRTSDHEIMWGDRIYDPEGHEIMWGDSSVSDGDEIMWGDSVPDNDH